MMRKFMTVAVGLVLVLSGWPAGAGQKEDVARIRAAMTAVGAKYSPDTVKPTPIDGIYQVTAGAKVYYVSADGKYLFHGDVVSLREKTSITEPVRRQLRKNMIDAVGEKNMLIFAPDHPKYVVNVFTDIDCPYCRKLHSQIDEYNRLGIEIRYLFLPRAGLQSPSYDKAVSVWCGDDRHQAMTDAQDGGYLLRRECKNPVRDHYELAHELGFRATPTMVTDSGEVHVGYLSPQDLLKLLDEQNSNLGPRKTNG